MKKNKVKKNSESDLVTNRILIVFSLAFVAVLLLMFAYRYLSVAGTAYPALQIIELLTYVFLAAAVFCAVLLFLSKKRGDRVKKAFSSEIFMFFFAILSVSCFMIAFFEYMTVIKLLYAVIPGIAVLYLIYAVYPREFFISSVSCASVALAIWAFGTRGGIAAHVISITLCVLCAAYAAFISYLRVKDGELRIASRTFRILPLDSGYNVLFGSAALCFLASLAAIFITGTLVINLTYVLLGYIFALAVYYTVKLM